MQAYQPDKYTIQIGLPSTPEGLLGLNFNILSTTIEDWVSMSESKSVKQFNFMQGVVSNEPFVDYIPNKARLFSLTILQKSPQVASLMSMIRLQEIGFLGWPFLIIDNGKDSNNDQVRQKKAFLSFIQDEPEESYSLEGGTLIFNIQAVYGQVLYI